MANQETKEEVQIPKEFEKIVTELDKMSALEISKFVKFLEAYWGVSAAAAMPMAVMANNSEAAPAVEEKSEFDVVLKDAGSQKVAIIKAIKELTGLGLGEAKAIADAAPKTVLEKVKTDVAESARKLLVEAGGTVELV